MGLIKKKEGREIRLVHFRVSLFVFTIESLKLTKFICNFSDIQLNVSSDHIYLGLNRFWQKFLCSVIDLEQRVLGSFSFLTFLKCLYRPFTFAISSDMKFTPVTYLT